MVPDAQGRNATCRTFSKPVMVRLEFQNWPSFWAKREAMVSSAASQGGKAPS
jgi:hypothetical protein